MIIVNVMPKSVDECLSGNFLYGDDFSAEMSKHWFDQEQTACFDIAAATEGYLYSYHALHWEHGYRYLPKKLFRKVLGFGSARGDEFDGIRERCGEITIVEPADGYKTQGAHYVKPAPDGSLPFVDGSFDLITCFGVLHHICKVSVAFAELARCLAAGGFLLVSEPITSMGDWRRPRTGLTPNERGIPLRLFHRMIQAGGLSVLRETPTEFRPLMNASLACGIRPFNSRAVTRADALICKFLPYRYHAKSVLEKFRPVGIYFVLHRVLTSVTQPA
jgi:SAM-dependent methyltransferase